MGDQLENLQRISVQMLARSMPAYRRYLYRHLGSGSRLIGIKGARGAGKSTFLLQYAREQKLAVN